MTLVELLAALAIITVLGTMVAAAMMTGSRVMAETTNASNASILEQSIDTALSDVLRYANVQAPAGEGEITDPVFNSDSYTDFSGSPVRAGQIVVDGGKLALLTSTGLQPIPKAAGIYTDFVVTDFKLTYNCDSDLFTCHYTLSTADGLFTRTCTTACRTLVGETRV